LFLIGLSVSQSRSKAAIYTSAEQFVLYYLGQYDDESAEFQLITPEAVMRASDCKDPEVGKRQTYEEQLEEIIHQVEAWQKKVDKEMADHGTTIHEIRNIVYRMEQANNE